MEGVNCVCLATGCVDEAIGFGLVNEQKGDDIGISALINE